MQIKEKETTENVNCMTTFTNRQVHSSMLPDDSVRRVVSAEASRRAPLPSAGQGTSE